MIINNRLQLEAFCEDLLNRYNGEQMSIEAEVIKKDKTQKQLGFFFGALATAVRDYFFEHTHEKTDKKDIKNKFYDIVAKSDDSFNQVFVGFDGVRKMVPMTLSDMDIEQASRFIDICIWLIDNAPMFSGLILHPSIRYTWVKNITKQELRELNGVRLPDKCPEYLSHTRKQACLCCGRTVGVEPHHLREAGVSGTGKKAPDPLCIPLCNRCHIQILHQHGQESFYKNLDYITKYISLRDFCIIRYLRWLNKM